MEKKADIEQKIGALVSLKTHPIHSTKDLLLHIGGDAEHIPPIMVITEILESNRHQFDENSGEKIKYKRSYKCIWFSHKTYTIQENWINEFDLDFIPEQNKYNTYFKNDTNLKIGTTVLLKSTIIEQSKFKSSIVFNNNDIEPSNKITSLQSFTSPSFFITGSIIYEPTEPIFNKKTNEQIRWCPKKLYKCKYFNPIQSKFSEILLPQEALLILPDFSNLFDQINDTIKENKYLLVKQDLNIYLLENMSALYINGLYSLCGIDLIKNKNISLILNESTTITSFNKNTKIYFPKFKKTNTTINVDFLNNTELRKILKNKITDKVIRIKYLNHQEKITYRIVTCIKASSLSFNNPNLQSKKSNNVPKKIDFLEAWCHLKEDTRDFITENILEIETLTITSKLLK